MIHAHKGILENQKRVKYCGKSTQHFAVYLKVPKCEIFDRSEFPDFYTIKSGREGDFGVKIKNF
jgi:hypothetical protein